MNTPRPQAVRLSGQVSSITNFHYQGQPVLSVTMRTTSHGHVVVLEPVSKRPFIGVRLEYFTQAFLMQEGIYVSALLMQPSPVV